MQRLRIKFSRGEEIKFISHLDIMRLWQRAFNRAGVPLAYSEGFNPHPRLSLAAPLALGVTSEAELMDVFLTRWFSPQAFMTAMKHQMPRGVTILQALPVGLNLPSLQSQVRFAEYQVTIQTDLPADEITARLDALLDKESIPWTHRRDTGLRSYDLRPLIEDIWLIECRGNTCTIGMRLRCDSSGTGRPEQVTLAAGFTEYPVSIHRTRLLIEAK